MAIPHLFKTPPGFSATPPLTRPASAAAGMSHIETGNTKLSLSVFAAIAQALEVPADELLSGSSAASQVRGELAALCDACTPAQLRVITELARAAKSAMEQQGFC